MVPAGPLAGRRPAELPAPEDERRVEQPEPLQVGKQGGDRFVDVGGQFQVGPRSAQPRPAEGDA